MLNFYHREAVCRLNFQTLRGYQDALTAGYERFELAPFLVKQIVAVERVDIVPRMLR